MSRLKISAIVVIWPKNDAKEQETKKKKENVGFFSVISSFFALKKKRYHHENLPFYLIRYGSSRDSSSPYETKNLIFFGWYLSTAVDKRCSKVHL